MSEHETAASGDSKPAAAPKKTKKKPGRPAKAKVPALKKDQTPLEKSDAAKAEKAEKKKTAVEIIQDEKRAKSKAKRNAILDRTVKKMLSEARLYVPPSFQDTEEFNDCGNIIDCCHLIVQKDCEAREAAGQPNPYKEWKASRAN